MHVEIKIEECDNGVIVRAQSDGGMNGYTKVYRSGGGIASAFIDAEQFFKDHCAGCIRENHGA